MDEKKYEIKEVLFWGDEIFKPGDLVMLQDKCENVYKGKIVKLRKGTESGKDTYSGKAHIILDMSGVFDSEQIPILLDEIETLDFGQGGSDNPSGCIPGCTCKPGEDQPGSDTEKEPEGTPTPEPGANPDETGGGEETPNAN